MQLSLIEATGNRFGLVDGFRHGAVADPGALAMLIGARDDLAVDGLLQLLRPGDESECDVRMAIHNVDGSLAQACGNGIRCIARVALERGYVAGPTLRVGTEAGVRVVEATDRTADGFRVRTEMGCPDIAQMSATIAVREGVLEVLLVGLGNPHCILFIPEISHAPVQSIGPQLETHERFPDRTNVEFVDVRKDELRVRVWERGVGETRACGSGACAAAVAAIAHNRIQAPVRVVMPGGELVVDWNGQADGTVYLEGGVGAPSEEIDAAS